MNARQRIDRVRALVKQQGLDYFLVSLPANITYLTGYLSRDSWLLFFKGKPVYITDARYTSEAKKNLGPGFLVRQIEDSLLETVNAIIREQPVVKLGFEEKHITVYTHQRLRGAIAKNIELIPTQGMVESLRETKDRQEIAMIRKATQIAMQALKSVRQHIVPGAGELEIAGEIERFIRLHGGHGSSFEIIVASGPNSSYPHHKTSDRKIRRNEPVLIDMGVEYFGYKSDLTRVFFSGKINPLVRKVYDIVAMAQKLAIKSIRPSVKTNEVDMAARQYIAGKGYGGFFSHSLGHGIGLEVHESPRLSAKENRGLKAGMVVTVEPAVYIPDEFGIRIEDMAVVTRKGAEVLSGTLDK